MNRVDVQIGRVAQANDLDAESSAFKRADFLSDKRLGEAWVAFQNEGGRLHDLPNLADSGQAGRNAVTVFSSSGRLRLIKPGPDQPVHVNEAFQQPGDDGFRRSRLTGQIP